MVVSRIIVAVLSLGVLSSIAGAQETKTKFKPSDFEILSTVRETGKITKADFDLLSESAQKNYLTLKTDTVKIEKLNQVFLPKPPTGKPFPGTPGVGGKDPLQTIDRIINIGKKIWDIIEKNKPVVDLKNDYASAVPAGITHWSQLETWKMPKTTVYRLTAKNAYGIQTVGVEFAVVRTWGGSYKGKGQFLHAVTVEPLKLDVLWGYTLNMKATIPSTVNVGTSEDPIAAMMVKLGWTIKTVIKESGGSGIYHVRGDGKFNDIGARSSISKMKAGEKLQKKLENLQVKAPF